MTKTNFDSSTHAPDEHPNPAAQALLQAPQWLSLVFRFASQPLALVPSQLSKPAEQVVTSQAPAVQVAEAGVATFALVQVVSQAPQWVVLVVVSASQPLRLLPSQLPKPAEQVVTTQALAVQVAETGVATLLLVQVALQAPQWVVSLVVACSQPLKVSLSQLPKPAEQVVTTQAPAEQVAEAGVATLVWLQEA